ncbi:hypothetical protein MY11210_007613 [Beauveria gryllotalpidicola]
MASYKPAINGYASIAAPLTKLLKKDTAFVWGGEQEEAMEELKRLLTTAPILITLSYAEGAGPIVLQVDSSPTGWGAVLMQEIEGRRQPARFESGIWSSAEAKYDQTKRECRGLLCAIRWLRGHIYGTHFILETDVLVLKQQINGGAKDIAGALIMRWLSYIRLFDFTVVHIPGEKNLIADALSRKPLGPSDILEAEYEGDLEEFVDLALNPVRCDVPLLKKGYSDKSHAIANFLATS